MPDKLRVPEWVTDEMIAASIAREATCPDVRCNLICTSCKIPKDRLRDCD